MAVPNIIVTLSGTGFPIPQVGSSPWGQNVTNWIVAASGPNGFIQLGGGTQSLAADLNFGASFGLISIYYKSRSANIAAAGLLRLANIDNIDWRNFGNTADCILTPGHTASSQSVDDLYYQNGTTGVFTQLTGNPCAIYQAPLAIAWPTTAAVITGFTTLVLDTDSAYNTGTGIFTVPTGKGGQYLVSVTVCGTSGAITTDLTLAIHTGGGTVAGSIAECNVSNAVTVTVTYMLNLAAGATISFFNTATVANAGITTSTLNYFSIKRIS